MGWEPSVYVPVLLLAAVLAALTTALLLRERPKSGSTALAGTTGAIALWSIGQLAVVTTTSSAVLVFGYVVTLTASLVLTGSWVIFACQYTGRSSLLTARSIGAALLFPILGSLAAVTNEPVGLHELMLANVEIVSAGGQPALAYDIAAGTWLFAVYIWTIAMVGNWFLAKKFLASRNVYRRRTFLLLVIGLTVLASTVVSVLELDPFQAYTLTPIVFVALGPVILAVLVSYRTLSFVPLDRVLAPFGGQSENLTPIARNTIIEEMDIGVLVLDHQNRIVDLNPAARSLFAEQRLVGRELTSVVTPDLFLTDEPTFLDPTVTDATFEGVWVELADGERRCYDLTISSSGLGDPDTGKTGRVVLIADETDRERRREELEARTAELERQNEQLEDFAHVVSHDLRNPVNVASGYVDLAETEGEPEHFEQVRVAHERIESLIDDVLLMVRQGKTVEKTESIDIELVAKEAWGNVDTKTAELELAAAGSVQADRSRLLQLLENLFRNAIEHAGSDVTVTVGTADDGFFVADDGPGIPAERRDEVFEKGVSGSESGTGLGLSIVSTIVEAHGWAIEVTESADGGARFEITVADQPQAESLAGVTASPEE